MAGSIEYRPSNFLTNVLKNVNTMNSNLDVKIPEWLREDNLYRATHGLDRNGSPLTPVKDPSNPKRRGNGPALAPRGANSRIVTAFEVEASGPPDQRTFTAGWNADAFFLPHHIKGTKHLPVRDVAGITPVGRERIRSGIREELNGIFKE